MISFFKSSRADKPVEAITIEKLLNYIQYGKWIKQIQALRDADSAKYNRLKNNLPAVTVSGTFTNRDKQTPIEDRLIKHSGFICIDIDRADNPKMRVKDLVDKECFAQFVSCSGEGMKIIYRCKPVATAAEHRRIYDAVLQRLAKSGIKLKVDPVVKSLASLQYVTYDPDLYHNAKTKLVVSPLPPLKKNKKSVSEDALKDLEQLNSYIDSLGDRDVTKSYENWLLICFGLTYSLGELGREPFHRLSANYEGYSESETNEKFDSCLEGGNNMERPVTISTVFQILVDALPKIKLKQLAKVYNKSHAVGIGEDVEQEDLSGMVRYKLFLFKKIFDKELNVLTELVPTALNLNEFERLLKAKGFFRFGKSYIWIQNNIVEEVDLDDIMRIITTHVEQDGDYAFMYKKLEFRFPWEELVHLWRNVRAWATTYNQISASLEHWEPNLLRDNVDESFIPYLNGVVCVSSNHIELIPYKNLEYQIWKERILPRDYVQSKRPGMFEEFFANVTGRGETLKSKLKSEYFTRALWYFGYMLHSIKRQSTARAWLLYDIKTGNNGRSGKTIIGSALGKIRSVVKIDGKQLDMKNRFAFQTVQPWTDIVFIDDPSKFMSIAPLFNMITGEMSADRKNMLPIVKDVKFMFASNWIMESEGASEIGRQFVTQLDDFYVRFSKENNDTITPIVDYHGKEFFSDWDTKDWSQFDSFAIRAIQHYFTSESPKNNIMGNTRVIRFVQLNEQELYHNLCHVFCDNVTRDKAGKLVIVQGILIDVVKENRSDVKNVTAGKIARDFLQAIGGGKIEITSVVKSGRTMMAYRLENDFKTLDFGDVGKDIIHPPFSR